MYFTLSQNWNRKKIPSSLILLLLFVSSSLYAFVFRLEPSTFFSLNNCCTHTLGNATRNLPVFCTSPPNSKAGTLQLLDPHSPGKKNSSTTTKAERCCKVAVFGPEKAKESIHLDVFSTVSLLLRPPLYFTDRHNDLRHNINIKL